MAKNKFLLIALVGLVSSLVIIPANAGTWYRHQADSFDYEYQYDDGTWAKGWNYIGGEWYYFDDYLGTTYYNPLCEWNNTIGSYIGCDSPITIDGKSYYFDKEGHLLHDCFIIQGSGRFQYWLDSNGHMTEGFYGSKYSGNYDLSQKK